MPRPGPLRSNPWCEFAFPDGAVPPIEVFRLDDDYFVLDGHKRVAAASAAGVKFVDADVTEIYAQPR